MVTPKIVTTAMSKIASFGGLVISIPEKKASHHAPYFKVRGPGGKETSVRIDTFSVEINDGFKLAELREVKKWAQAYQVELLRSWEVSLTAKAPPVPTKMPRPAPSYPRGLKLTEALLTGDFQMALRFSNGEVRVADYRPLLRGLSPDLATLRKGPFFRKGEVVAGDLEWPDGTQFEAGYLYGISSPLDASTLRAVREKSKRKKAKD